MAARRGDRGASELRQSDRYIACLAAHKILRLLMKRFVKRDDGARRLEVDPSDGGRREMCAAAVKERRADFLFLRGKQLRE